MWIGKILETPHPDVRLAMKRNMYLAQLILYLYDGKLKAPFTSVPADGPLATYDELPFYGGAPDGQRAGGTVAPETANRELPLDELNHVSSDGRTYVAVQSLCDGATLFGYVAVTIGHAGSLWLNSRGETMWILCFTRIIIPRVYIRRRTDRKLILTGGGGEGRTAPPSFFDCYGR